MSAPIGTIIEDEQEFLNDVEAFYHERGVPWERDAKVAGRPISLHELFKTVMEIGGYDKISAERMRWRTLVQPFGLGTTHEPAMTFQLKTVYYKNLAAYEIARYWGEEPPPREILEDLTAKGGDLRNRKLETYPLQSRNTDGRDSDDEELQRTPVRDKPESEEPGSGRRYPTRELRQDPKRTQIYQPDPTPQRTRFTRTTSSPQPTPVMAASYNHVSADPRNPTFSIDRYEPRQPMALTLRPVLTPGNAADIFYQRKAMERAQAMPRLPPDTKFLDQLKNVVPYTTRQGSGIYTRCHMGLMSGIKEEQAFALHHLVKVSFERGDKFTFKGFPSLAESLLEKALEISVLIHGFRWQISYDQDEGISTRRTLNACFGTPNLLETVQSLEVVMGETEPETDEFLDQLERLNEAALVVRNMVTLEENASFLSKFPLFRDFLIVAINLPQQPRLTEFRQYALEMAEQTTRYWVMERKDPLYLSLVAELESPDRGRILSAIRAINHIGVELEQVFQITDIPQSTIERMVSFVLLDDDELVEGALDFLYEYTAIADNVVAALQQGSQNPTLIPSITPRLTTLLLHNAVSHEEKIQNRPFPNRSQLQPSIPVIPNDLYMQLLQYPEPERSSRWLRCCFEDSPQDDITQIAIWQAYQGRFSQTSHIAAADFIKNVSTTFHQAQAQVINAPQPRFIIKGIKPRRILVDPQGRGFFKCLWEVNRTDAQIVYDGQGRQRHVCGAWHSTRPNVWYHILQDHCGLQRGADGKFLNTQQSSVAVSSNNGNNGAVNGTASEATTNGTNANSSSTSTTSSTPPAPTKTYKCHYLSCPRSHNHPFTSAVEFGIHVRGHIPETADTMGKVINEIAIIPAPGQTGMPRQKEPSKDEMYTRHTFYYTVTDERQQPCGIPFMAAMVLRNLARFVGRHGAKINTKSLANTESVGSLSPSMRRRDKSEIERKQDLMGRLFSANVRAELWHVLSVHRTLGVLVGDLVGLIEKGEQGEKKRIREEDFETSEVAHTTEDVVAT